MSVALPLLFVGLSFGLAVGATQFEPNAFAFDEPTRKEIALDDKNEIELGSFPFAFDKTLTEQYRNDPGKVLNEMADPNSFVQGEYTYFTIDSQRYYISSIDVAEEYQELAFSDGTRIVDVNGGPAIFAAAPIKWALLESVNGYVNVRSKYVLFENVFDENPAIPNYISSQLYAVMHNHFASAAFTEQELGMVQKQEVDGKKDVLFSFPNKGGLDNDEGLMGASDYAIATGVICQGDFSHAAYWGYQFYDGTNHFAFTNSGLDTIPCNTRGIGVRPIIRLEAETSNPGGGGGGGSTISVNFTGNIPMIIIGLVSMGAGITVLLVFLKKLLAKMKTSGFKPGWKYYIIFIVSMSITVIGCYVYSGGTMNKFNFEFSLVGKRIVGYYQGNGYDCVGFGERLWMGLTSDHQVYRYIGDAWADDARGGRAFCHPQPGIGTWEYSGGVLTITAGEGWALSSWESPVQRYTNVNGIGSFVTVEGYEGHSYQWYHADDAEPVYESRYMF